MSYNLKVAKECGAFVKYQLTSALGKVPAEVIFNVSELEAYTFRILASQQAAHEAEIAKLKQELESERRICTEYIEQRNDALAACAMKDEALKEAKQIIAYLVHEYGLVHADFEVTCSTLDNAISASTQQVSEWERKRLEPLRAQVAMLTEALTRIRDEDIGPAKCVSIAYKALAPLPNESDSPETALEEALRRQ